MRSSLFLLLFVLASACRTVAPTSEFVYCPPAKFANCTVAKCTPNAGGNGYSCNCFLDERYSATSSASTCVAATATTAQSRFHPVESYQLCSNPRTESSAWAWCLGVPCTIDANGTGVACNCTVPPAGVRLFPYVVVTSKYLPDGCQLGATGEVWSSATPGDVAQITRFLMRQPGLNDLRQPVVLSTPEK